MQTDRLSIRPWCHDEAERLFDIRRREEVAKWLGSPEPWADLQRARDAIVQWEGMRGSDDPFGQWAIVPHGKEPVGSVLLRPTPDNTEIEIGWYLHPDSTGAGWASEAASVVLEHGLGVGIERIWAIMWPHNVASARVALAIGMTDLGVRDDPWYGSGEEPTSRMFCAGPGVGSL
ncbi:MAG: GNAT family N-acetyltransferase [Acidimicrobiales bacterium]